MSNSDSENLVVNSKMFQQLRSLQTFSQKNFPCLQSPIDGALVVEIGYHEEQGRPLTVKGLLALKLGAPATVRRRLQRLVNLGAVHKRRANHDRRLCQLEVDPTMRKRYARYLKLILEF